MLYPAVNELIKGEIKCRYSLCIAVATRARQIAEKAEENGVKLTEKPIKMAVNDFATGEARFYEKHE